MHFSDPAGKHRQPQTWVPWPPPKDYQLDSRPWRLPPHRPMIISGAELVDPEHGETVKGMDIRIEDGKIVEIAPCESLSGYRDQRNATVIDATGLYICPGLIDCHVHILAGLGTAEDEPGTEMENDLNTALGLKYMLSNGFTTVRDVGGATAKHRYSTESWLTPGPRLFVGGPVMSMTGGHGDHRSQFDMLSTNSPYGQFYNGGMEHTSTIADGVDECLRTARKLMAAGADHVKICTSGGVLSPYDKVEAAQYTVPEIRAVCETVKALGGTLTTSHCNSDLGARNAIEGGVGCIEHGGMLSRDTLQSMKEKGIHLVPTLIVQDAVVNGPLRPYVSKRSYEKAKTVASHSEITMKDAVEIGVNIGYGTDYVPMFQLAEFDLRAAFLPSKEVLKHATCNAAKILGMEGKLGCIKEGALADFLLLSANPIDNVKILNRPDKHLKAVVKDGRCVKSSVKGLPVEVELF
ncbi:amidohydrolase [Kockovaella imperatae]|uniref:Amidohydrolase n=1 Tax=Kockovaella imperatae TaxID=4999 RepID=A0A1Y1UNC0_9TREE|nr:amidohydrolase [Kockovaella imperatae]ORX38956.1 amidohydrolase [Kockovaella imperatae]